MIFTYKAVDKNGNMVTGTREAIDRSQVVSYLKAQRMTPVQVSNGASTDLASLLPQPRPKAKDLSMFCEQFCALLRAGVTILDTLRLLLSQTTDRSLKDAIQTTINGVNEGESLASAMGKSPVAFDETLVSLVRAGEASGSLDVSLDRMSQQYKKDAEIAAAIKKAMVYPIIVMVVAIAVVIVMLLVVIPKFTSMFADIGMEMPKITLVVMAASEWMMNNWLVVIIGFVAFLIALITFFKSKTGKRVKSKLALILPGINKFTVKSSASKIARTLSTLLTAGMPLVDALTILESTLQNYYYKEAIRAVREDVLNGQPMSRKFTENSELFPPMLSHMITVGEDTGDITSMLIRTADYYDLEVETATEAMMSMMQPAIIILLTAIVGVLIAAVFAPMVTLYSQLGDSL